MKKLKIFSWFLIFISFCLSCKKEEPSLYLTLNKNELILSVGETSELLVATNSTKPMTWNSSDISVATVEYSGRTNAYVTGEKVGTAIITVSIDKMSYTCRVIVYDPFNDEGAVINGVKWATRNVDHPGSFTFKPEFSGMLYQWNRKVGWSSYNPLQPSDNTSSWKNLRVDNNNVLYWEESNDPCPCGWRVPNREELESLLNVRGVWSNSPAGYYLGSPPNRIFLPAAGYRIDTDAALLRPDNQGNYWSAESAVPFASGLNFNKDGLYMNYPYLGSGLSVRCVAVETTN